MDNATQKSSNTNSGPGLTAILTSLQQGVIGINNATASMKAIFPSSS